MGIVFVHGIGSQAPGETLLDWGGAIIGLLLDVRVAQKATGDPVIASQLDPAPGESRYIELQLPAARSKDGTKIPEQHWVMTEAWWAQRVRPPKFGQMAEWLGPRGAISRILLAIGPRQRDEHNPRLRPWTMTHPLRRARGRVEETAERGSVAGEGPGGPGGLWQALAGIGRVGTGLYLQAASALILVVYGALRSIESVLPIGPLKDGALTRPIDEFMLDWFGDVYVLLRDPAQAASVRGRLTDALLDLHHARCDTVVVVAHSGGAIVSYMTLADPANASLRVDRLITLGEGLNLAWLLSGGDETTNTTDTEDDIRRRYERLYGDIFKNRDDLTWHDFWASQDPAPVGVLKVPKIGAVADAELPRITSHGIWNRLSFGEDHGTYWDNDEEFLLPMIRLLDGTEGGKRFFGAPEDDAARSNRRRRRLSMLSVWRQLTLVAPTAAIVIAFATGSDFLQRASDAVAALWNVIPGKEIVTGPLNTVRDLGMDQSSLGSFVAETGVWVIAALIGLVTIFALVAPPERPVPWAVGRWTWMNGVLRWGPRVVGILVAASVVLAWAALIGGSSQTATQVGRYVLGAVVGIVVLAILVVSVFGPPATPKMSPRWAIVSDFFEMLFTIIVMSVAGFLAIAPVVATLLFVDTGRLVLGALSVIGAFQILGRIGAWRWNVWDGRERVAARTSKPYPSLRRVIVQIVLLVAVTLCLLAAIVTDVDMLAAAAAIGAGFCVLLGISVDVFDASRQERTAPTQMMLRSAQVKY